LKYGTYGFKGELSISDVADANNELTKPISIEAAGDGTAVIKIDGNAVISIDVNGKLSTNGYIATSNNHLVTKAITDAITTALNALTQRVTALESTSDQSVYSNGVISSGTNGRYNVDQTVIYAATTENITLSGTQTIDGTTPADGSFIFVKNQTDAKENGIYAYSSSSLWQRVTDFSDISAFVGKIFNITNGTQNGGKMFYMARQVFPPEATIDNVELNFIEYFGSIAPKANKIPMRDSTGHVKTASPSASDDAVNKGALLNLIYPIGSLYWTSKAPNDNGDPNSLFGGTWVQIKNRFILAAGDTYANGATGGSATVTLTVAQMPSHTHSGKTDDGGVAHTHEVTGTTGNDYPDHTHYATYFYLSPVIADGTGLAYGTNRVIGTLQHVEGGDTNGASARHVHDFNGTTGGASAYNHKHNFTTGSAGGGQAHDNMPPYIVKFCWERVS
jgi:microcystin-dependent protein